ncbi:ATP-dependent helicase HrpB, partial [Streptomyces adustus]
RQMGIRDRYRCWSEAEDSRLPRFPAPEIKVADLTAFALQAACWGDPEASGLALLDPPPGGAMAAARSVLTAIGAVDAAGRATPRGVRMARLGLHPRLGRALLDAAASIGAERAAEVVALLGEEPPREYGDDLAAALRAARRGGDAYAARWRAETRRLRAAAAGAADPGARSLDPAAGSPDPTTGSLDPTAGSLDPIAGSPNPTAGSRDAAAGSAGTTTGAVGAVAGAAGARTGAARAVGSVGGVVSGGEEERLVGLVVALAFPERVARARGGSLLMASGTRAELREGSGLRGASWLAVAVADRPLGQGHARVQFAAVVDEDVARLAAAPLLSCGQEVRWADGDVVARRVERLGAVELTVRPLTDPDPGLVRKALVEGLRQEGFGLLRWTQEAESLRRRLAFLRLHLGDPWPAVDDEALHARVDDWLEPELGRARRRADLARIDAREALGRLLPWASGDAARLDELAPERITVPSGSGVRIDYGDPQQPVLAVKLQEMFGLQRSPAVAGVPLLVHLLSPAGRPAAVTADLASFWKVGYKGVRAELRGRYPKHPWPEDPATAEPTRHTNARLRR